MKQYLALLGAGLLAVSSSLTAVSAQTGDPVNADGAYVVANDDGAPIVSGAGDDIYYGAVNTGGRPPELLGDPNAVYSPNVPDNPGPGAIPVIPGAGDGLIGEAPIQPAAPDATTMTTTSLASTEGTATENVPVETMAPAESVPVTTESAPVSTESAPVSTESAPVATDTTAAAGGFCAQYATWYDAQVAYENLGATTADPALVEEVDLDYDGIACEALMA